MRKANGTQGGSEASRSTGGECGGRRVPQSLTLPPAAGTQGARVRGVEVPQEARAGEDVSLRCLVDPWPDPLYSLAWWKDGEQIYRVAVVPTPPGDPHALPVRSMVTVFALPGLSLKRGRGGLGHVVLQEVTVAASGNYTCEAVADFPTFTQSMVSANLTVVDPPDTRPILAGYKGRYYPGELMTVTCTVLRASPVPVVTWFINNRKVQAGKNKVLEVRAEPDLTSTLVTRLTVHLKREHFQQGVLNLTCGARTGRSLWLSNTITTHHARHRNAPGYSTHYQGGAGGFDFDPGQERLLSGAPPRVSRIPWRWSLLFASTVLHFHS
ncbi:hypothetical protein C7M84_008185 [Penaeus vannamei]|uniref:Ig-like domain-containing protein n=1 Tax=Penaeus vannamei TaxID=6689 RepID=A0A3R7PJ00_PENVA|nr:hypothetical protein C7M84_008185 [Penaeus vannamei]